MCFAQRWRSLNGPTVTVRCQSWPLGHQPELHCLYSQSPATIIAPAQYPVSHIPSLQSTLNTMNLYIMYVSSENKWFHFFILQKVVRLLYSCTNPRFSVARPPPMLLCSDHTWPTPTQPPPPGHWTPVTPPQHHLPSLPC